MHRFARRLTSRIPLISTLPYRRSLPVVRVLSVHGVVERGFFWGSDETVGKKGGNVGNDEGNKGGDGEGED